MAAAEFIEYSFRYAGSDSPALSGVNLSIPEGEVTLLCGGSGSGKTTLLRSMKSELRPVGKCEGRLRVLGTPPGEMALADSASRVGFVMQDPDNQIVTDRVWHELAFGLENLGLPTEAIRRRVAETAHFFGIGDWFEKKTRELSGGQKQTLNLAAVMAMQPDMLLLDEPTAQLDPVAAADFLQLLWRVNRELGMTVVLSEHRLEDVLPFASQVVFLEKGTLAMCGTPRQFVQYVYRENNHFACALPAAARLARSLPDRRNAETDRDGVYPLSVREGRRWLEEHMDDLEKMRCGEGNETAASESGSMESRGREHSAAIEARELWFRYGRTEDFVLKGADFTANRGELHAVVGGNGSGKSTLLKVLVGAERPSRGRVEVEKGLRIAMLAQAPQALFAMDSLEEDLMEWSERFGYSMEHMKEQAEHFGLLGLMKRHPYDLSGGEMQKAALLKLLLTEPDILLLDEPTKGIDAFAKEEMKEILQEQKEAGRTIALVTHDLEFAAMTADRCSMMFGGQLVCTGGGREFFLDNVFYTTGVNRMTRGILPGCVTVEDVSNCE